MLKILAVLLIIGVFVYVWYRNDLRRLTRDYACEEAFDGALEHCIVRFPVDEAGTDCMLGANNDGLYMSSSIEALTKKRRWSFRYYVIRTPLWSLRRTSALMRRRTPRSHQRILAQRRNERRSAGSGARFGPKTGRSVACYASELARHPHDGRHQCQCALPLALVANSRQLLLPTQIVSPSAIASPANAGLGVSLAPRRGSLRTR